MPPTCNSSLNPLHQNNDNSRKRIVLVIDQEKELILEKMGVKTGYTKISPVGGNFVAIAMNRTIVMFLAPGNCIGPFFHYWGYEHEIYIYSQIQTIYFYLKYLS